MVVVMLDLLKSIIYGLLLLLPISNPVFTMILYLGLSERISDKEHLVIARKTARNTFITMAVVYYTGSILISGLGISMPGLRISGGLIILFMGFRMLFPPAKSEQTMNPHGSDDIDISLVPLAMPGTVGPGTMAVIISYASSLKNGMMFSSLSISVAPILVFVIVSLLIWVGVQSSNAIIKKLGPHGVQAISKILGFVLISMGVQFVINGIYKVLLIWESLV